LQSRYRKLLQDQHKKTFITEDFLETHLQQLFTNIQTTIAKSGIENAMPKSVLALLKSYCILIIK
jgi:hypothetical protein